MSHHGEEGVALEWRLKKGGEEREGQRRLPGGKRALSQEKAQLGMENHVLLAQVTRVQDMCSLCSPAGTPSGSRQGRS